MAQDANQKKKLDEELQQLEDQVYGDETPSGTNPRPGEQTADTESMMQAVTGNDPSATNANGTANDDHIAQEMDKDELDRHTTAPIIQEPNPETIPQDSIPVDLDADGIAAPAGVSENLAGSVGDPFDSLSDTDFKKNK
jgi:hypothetical protein